MKLSEAWDIALKSAEKNRIPLKHRVTYCTALVNDLYCEKPKKNLAERIRKRFKG